MPAEYAHALYRAIQDAPDSHTAQRYTDALIAHLKREGRMRALPAIARELARIDERRAATRPVLSVARERDIERARTQLAKYLDADVQPATRVDERLIGGWRYTDTNTLVDASYKRALLDLYARITAQ